ncbi:hypothetical protein DFJ74DRAFT_762910 [Hyaloraphidium curvatum]|nr:hypothetical protein DFJ74DRAFT_762910 [Hyaloraphidium curvatum]
MDLHRRSRIGGGFAGNGAVNGEYDADSDAELSTAKTPALKRSKAAKRYVAERAESDGWERPTAVLLAAVFATFLFIHWHFWRTPAPVAAAGAYARGNVPVFSEEIARGHIRHLSETIGFRQVGTRAHEDAVQWTAAELERIRAAALERAKEGSYEPPVFEVEVLRSTGSHRFDIAGKMVHKLYHGIPSVLVRISSQKLDGALPREERWGLPSVILNSHLDTNYGSAGAADAASGIAVLLETARILSHRPTSSWRNPAVVLFNGAEESLQDASHAFMLSSPHNRSARALINLEACGQGGREALFQVNSRGMAEAYKRGGRNFHGSSLANDVFGTGLVLSDTDFRQFMAYGGDEVVGVDLAYYTNSFVYHTMKDVERTMGVGSVQHMGENAAGMAGYLVGEDLSDPKFRRKTDFLHFDFLGSFILYSWSFAVPFHLTVAAAGVAIWHAHYRRELAAHPKLRQGVKASHFAAAASLVLSMGLAAAGASSANLLHKLLGVRSMVWFSRAWHPAILFGSAALAGIAVGQHLARIFVAARWEPLARSAAIEARTIHALLLDYSLLFAVATLAGVGSSFLLLVQVLGLMAACLAAQFVSPGQAPKTGALVHQEPTYPARPPLASYLLQLAISGPLTMGYAISMSELFVPLLGRIGHAAPADAIAAGLGVVISGLVAVVHAPFIHRFGERHGRNTALVLTVLAGFIALYYSTKFPFDDKAPKRLYVQHRLNVTSGESFLDIAHADREARALDEAVAAVEERMGIWSGQPASERIQAQTEADHAAKVLEWEALYPFNYFLNSIRIPAATVLAALGEPYFAPESRPAEPSVHLLSSTWNAGSGTRDVHLEFRHKGLISCTASLGGEVIAWDLDSPIPEDEDSDPWNPSVRFKRVRHVIRTVGGLDEDTFTVRATVKHDSEDAKLRVDFWGLDRRSWGEGSGDFGPHGDKGTGWEGGEVLRFARTALPQWTAPMLVASVGGVWWF